MRTMLGLRSAAWTSTPRAARVSNGSRQRLSFILLLRGLGLLWARSRLAEHSRLVRLRELGFLRLQPRIVCLGPTGDVLVGIKDRAVAQRPRVLLGDQHGDHPVPQ